jgi:hypothetical protein
VLVDQLCAFHFFRSAFEVSDRSKGLIVIAGTIVCHAQLLAPIKRKMVAQSLLSHQPLQLGKLSPGSAKT